MHLCELLSVTDRRDPSSRRQARRQAGSDCITELCRLAVRAAGMQLTLLSAITRGRSDHVGLPYHAQAVCLMYDWALELLLCMYVCLYHNQPTNQCVLHCVGAECTRSELPSSDSECIAYSGRMMTMLSRELGGNNCASSR